MRVLWLATILAGTVTPALACERNKHGVYEDITCAAEAVTIARKEMESVLASLAARLDPEALKALEMAQEAWSQYRDAAVKFVYAQEGGSLGRLVVANDTERAIRARIEELNQWRP